MTETEITTLSFALLLLVMNFCGAGFTFFRLYQRRKAENTEASTSQHTTGADHGARPPRLPTMIFALLAKGFRNIDHQELIDTMHDLYITMAVPTYGRHAPLWLWKQIIKTAFLLIQEAPREIVAALSRNDQSRKETKH
jgi:hypothetical protein